MNVGAKSDVTTAKDRQVFNLNAIYHSHGCKIDDSMSTSKPNAFHVGGLVFAVLACLLLLVKSRPAESPAPTARRPVSVKTLGTSVVFPSAKAVAVSTIKHRQSSRNGEVLSPDRRSVIFDLIQEGQDAPSPKVESNQMCLPLNAPVPVQVDPSDDGFATEVPTSTRDVMSEFLQSYNQAPQEVPVSSSQVNRTPGSPGLAQNVMPWADGVVETGGLSRSGVRAEFRGYVPLGAKFVEFESAVPELDAPHADARKDFHLEAHQRIPANESFLDSGSRPTGSNLFPQIRVEPDYAAEGIVGVTAANTDDSPAITPIDPDATQFEPDATASAQPVSLERRNDDTRTTTPARLVDLWGAGFRESSGLDDVAMDGHATSSDQSIAAAATKRAFELGHRQALHSSRAEFIRALDAISRSLDDRTNSNRYSNSLRYALTAYREVADFVPADNRPGIGVRPEKIVEGHTTPVIRDSSSASLSVPECVRRYLAYAEERFTEALGSDPVAANALFGLGRLETTAGFGAETASEIRTQRALLFYQVAMNLDPGNFAAANEMGVLLAKQHRFNEARSVLRHCVQVAPHPTIWNNLAFVHRQLGEDRLANLAADEARQASASAKSSTEFGPLEPEPTLEWVSPQVFAGIEPAVSASDLPALNQESASRPANGNVADRSSEKQAWFWPKVPSKR